MTRTLNKTRIDRTKNIFTQNQPSTRATPAHRHTVYFFDFTVRSKSNTQSKQTQSQTRSIRWTHKTNPATRRRPQSILCAPKRGKRRKIRGKYEMKYALSSSDDKHGGRWAKALVDRTNLLLWSYTPLIIQRK